MAWGSAPAEPDKLRDMAEAGLNVAGFCRAEDLDRFQQAGVMCIVNDRRAAGYDFAYPAPEAKLRENIQSLLAETRDHPAVFGYYLKDEPTVAQFAGLAQAAALLREAAPEKPAYVNLYPIYVNAGQVGAASYEDYVRRMVDAVKPAFISYDNYSLLNGDMRDGYYTNLEVVRSIALEKRLPFWNVILSTAHFHYSEPSDATLRLQVYTTLAYGARGISYFTYFTPQIGNYRLGPLDGFGRKTATWDMLRRVNSDVHALAPTLARLKSTGVYHYPEVPEKCQPLSKSKLVKSVTFRPSTLDPPSRRRLLVGEFEHEKSGEAYLLLVNKEQAHSYHFTVGLRRSADLYRISPYTGEEELLAGEMNWLAPGQGVLLRVDFH